MTVLPGSSALESPVQRRQLSLPDLRPLDAELWETVFKQKPPLCYFSLDHSGWAFKEKYQPNKGLVAAPKWHRRWLVFHGMFAFYFKDDKLSSPCKGCVYLGGCQLEELPQYGGRAHCLRITSRLPHHPGAEGDYTVVLSLATAEQMRMWSSHIQNIAGPDKEPPSPEVASETEDIDVSLAAPAAPTTPPPFLPRCASSSIFSLMPCNSLCSFPSLISLGPSVSHPSLNQIPWVSAPPAPRASNASMASFLLPPLCPFLPPPSANPSPCFSALQPHPPPSLDSNADHDVPRAPPAPMRCQVSSNRPSVVPFASSPHGTDSDGPSPALAAAKSLPTWDITPSSPPIRIQSNVIRDQIQSPMAPSMVSPSEGLRLNLNLPMYDGTPALHAEPPTPVLHHDRDAYSPSGVMAAGCKVSADIQMPWRWHSAAPPTHPAFGVRAGCPGDDDEEEYDSDSCSDNSGEEDMSFHQPTLSQDPAFQRVAASEAAQGDALSARQRAPSPTMSDLSDDDYVIVAPNHSVPSTPALPKQIDEVALLKEELSSLKAEIAQLRALQLPGRWKRFQAKHLRAQRNQQLQLNEQQLRLTDLQHSLQCVLQQMTAAGRPNAEGPLISPRGALSPCGSFLSRGSSCFSTIPQLRNPEQMAMLQQFIQSPSPARPVTNHQVPKQRLPLPPHVLESNAQNRRQRLMHNTITGRPLESPSTSAIRHNPAITVTNMQRANIASPMVYTVNTEVCSGSVVGAEAPQTEAVRCAQA